MYIFHVHIHVHEIQSMCMCVHVNLLYSIIKIPSVNIMIMNNGSNLVIGEFHIMNFEQFLSNPFKA